MLDQKIAALSRIRHIHFVGIGGSGMSGIAEVLLNQHYRVTGSDAVASKATQHLQEMGATIYIGHDGTHVHGADVVVTSTAIADDNEEVIVARKKHIPVVPRAQMLAELMRFRYGIAIAGSHGKTTTTSLTASIMAADKLDPTFVIGGLLNSAGSNAKLGSSHYLVAEADESDGSFLFLNPMLAVLTNIDNDHLSNYNNDFQQLKQAFVDFLHRLPFYGIAVVCLDDENIKKLLPKISRPLLTYGFDKNADFYAYDIKQQGLTSKFTVHRGNQYNELTVTLNIAGKHNILNALASVAVATELGVSDVAICEALANYQGVARRFQIHGEISIDDDCSVMAIEDYGHHPREMEAVINTVKQVWPDKRLVMLFQPHRYSRTQALFDEFIEVLTKVDQLLLLPVYAASEKIIAGASSEDLYNQLKQKKSASVSLIHDTNNVAHHIAPYLQQNDILLFQGAGDISKIVKEFQEQYLAISII